jgi:hypothetical protein
MSRAAGMAIETTRKSGASSAIQSRDLLCGLEGLLHCLLLRDAALARRCSRVI